LTNLRRILTDPRVYNVLAQSILTNQHRKAIAGALHQAQPDNPLSAMMYQQVLIDHRAALDAAARIVDIDMGGSYHPPDTPLEQLLTIL
jgi:hypothetical protein